MPSRKEQGKFGARIQLGRLTKGYDCQALADRVHANTSAVWSWENGRLPRAKTIVLLAKALDIDAGELAKLWMEDSIKETKTE